MLITSAEDLVKAMGWESSPKTEKTVQRELFPDLSEEEERIVKRLGKMPEGLQINTLVIDTNIPVNRMSALLFELEMKGDTSTGRRSVPVNNVTMYQDTHIPIDIR